jgi:enoyl-CoA hydratase/carnithine racemase
MDQKIIYISGGVLSSAISSCWLVRSPQIVLWLTGNRSIAEMQLNKILKSNSGSPEPVKIITSTELRDELSDFQVMLMDDTENFTPEILQFPLQNHLLISGSWHQSSTGKLKPACFIFHSMLSLKNPLAEIFFQVPLTPELEKKISEAVFNWHKIPLIRTGTSLPFIPIFEMFLLSYCLQAVRESKVSAFEADFLISMLTGNREFRPLKLIDGPDSQYFLNIQRQLGQAPSGIPEWLQSFSFQKPTQAFFRSEKDKITHSLNLKTGEYDKVSGEWKKLRKFRSKFELEAFWSKKKKSDQYHKFIDGFLRQYREVLHHFSDSSINIFQLEDLLATGYHWQNNPLKQVPEESSTRISENSENIIPIWPKSPFFSLHGTPLVWSNRKSRIQDLKDGIFNLEFRGKMNIMGPEVIDGIWKAIEIAETQGCGLVIANQGTNFSAGAHLGILFLHAVEQNYREIEALVKQFQDTMLKVRDCTIPVVVAPHHLSLGGACEMSLHADGVIVLPETWMGLVEIKAGLLPGGGGTKALTVKAAVAGNDNLFMQYFRHIVMGKVSVDADDLQNMALFDFEVGYHFPEMFRLARKKALSLSRNYQKAVPIGKIMLPGRKMYQKMLHKLEELVEDSHQWKIGQMVAEIMSGGDLEGPIETTELELLKMERVAFTKLNAEKETLVRMKNIVSGKRS